LYVSPVPSLFFHVSTPHLFFSFRPIGILFPFLFHLQIIFIYFLSMFISIHYTLLRHLLFFLHPVCFSTFFRFFLQACSALHIFLFNILSPILLRFLTYRAYLLSFFSILSSYHLLFYFFHPRLFYALSFLRLYFRSQYFIFSFLSHSQLISLPFLLQASKLSYLLETIFFLFLHPGAFFKSLLFISKYLPLVLPQYLVHFFYFLKALCFFKA
jgi:hypothetical protein